MANTKKHDEINLPTGSDDFRAIKGIGESIARALFELGIQRYSDLAAYTAEDLANLLSSKVSFISAGRIERDGWLIQARTLAGAQVTSAAVKQQNDGTFGASQKQHNKIKTGSWHELADFFVSFGESKDADGETRKKTRVHFSQADQMMEWDGIAVNKLVQWMVRQGHLPLPDIQQETPMNSAVETGENQDIGPQLSIENLWVSQVDMDAAPSGRQKSPQRMVRVEAKVGYSDTEKMPALQPPDSVSVDIFLVETNTGRSIFIENPPFPLAGELSEHEFTHDIAVPPPGRYQLYLLGRYSPHRKTITLRQGPIVRVV